MSIVNNLKKHIEENKDKLRCGFCSNELIHSTKANVYDFPDIETSTDNKDVYGVLCDDCNKNNRTPNNVILLLGDKNSPSNVVYYIPLTDRILIQKRNLDASVKLGDIPPSNKQDNKLSMPQNPNARTEKELKQIEKDIMELEEQDDDGE